MLIEDFFSYTMPRTSYFVMTWCRGQSFYHMLVVVGTNTLGYIFSRHTSHVYVCSFTWLRFNQSYHITI